ncbi:hypothetical protein JX266_005395 [Neoarthrinium moseri]|nr:hypothetical protein JX266_005395 [Neoarthrinium moseri]
MHLQQVTYISAMVALGLISVSNGLGINCRGSSMCSTGDVLTAQNLRNSINGLPDDKYFKSGEHIACDPAGLANPIPWAPRIGGSICAFVQNKDGLNGKELKRLAQFIVDHGCKMCGSVPTDFPDKNDVKNGELTFNYVAKPKCREGLC